MKKITKATINRSIKKDTYDEVASDLSNNSLILSKSIKELEKEWAILTEQYQENLTMLSYTMGLVSERYPERLILSENSDNRNSIIGFNVKHTEFEKYEDNIFDKMSKIYRSLTKFLLKLKYRK